MRFVVRYSRVLLLLILIGVLWATAPRFMSWGNWTNLLIQAGLLALLSYGMTLCMLSGGIDLSNGSTIAFAGCLGAFFLEAGNTALGVLVTLGAGLGVGLVNGALIGWLAIPPVVATFGMFFMARGAATYITGGRMLFSFSDAFRWFGTGGLQIGDLKISVHVFLALLLYGALLFAMRRTTFGRGVYAMGSNETAARYSGIPIARTLLIVYGLSGLLSAVAGLTFAARLNSIGPDIGPLFPLDAVAVTVIGGTSFAGGEGGVSGTIMGALFIALLQNGIQLLGFAAPWQLVVQGGVVVLAILLNQGIRTAGARLAQAA